MTQRKREHKAQKRGERIAILNPSDILTPDELAARLKVRRTWSTNRCGVAAETLCPQLSSGDFCGSIGHQSLISCKRSLSGTRGESVSKAGEEREQLRRTTNENGRRRLKGFGFEYWRTQPGLDDFNLVSYVKGRIVVEVNQWHDDWNVSRAYGPGDDLAAARPALDELRKLTPSRQRRIAFLIKEANEQMKTVPSGTVVGYNVVSGEKLFTERNRATRFPDQTDALPQANDLYHTLNSKTYRVVAVRNGSTETLCEMDVREEASR